MKYTKDKTKLLQVRVSAADIETLDAIAAFERRTRSDVIRMLISARGVTDNGQKEEQNRLSYTA